MIIDTEKYISGLMSSFELLDLPETRENTISVCRRLLGFVRVSPNVMSIYFAHLRNFFGKDGGGFVTFCHDELGMEGKYMFQLVAVGKMILDLKAAGETEDVKRLLYLDFGKNLTIARIPGKDIPRFLRAYQVEDIKRDELRNIVNKLLGKAKKEKVEQPELFGVLDKLADFDDADFADAAERMDYSGAQKSVLAAIGLSEAAIGFFRTHEKDADTVFLAGLESEYRQKAQDIADIRAKLAIAAEAAEHQAELEPFAIAQ